MITPYQGKEILVALSAWWLDNLFFCLVWFAWGGVVVVWVFLFVLFWFTTLLSPRPYFSPVLMSFSFCRFRHLQEIQRSFLYSSVLYYFCVSQALILQSTSVVYFLHAWVVSVQLKCVCRMMVYNFLQTLALICSFSELRSSL